MIVFGSRKDRKAYNAKKTAKENIGFNIDCFLNSYNALRILRITLRSLRETMYFSKCKRTSSFYYYYF